MQKHLLSLKQLYYFNTEFCARQGANSLCASPGVPVDFPQLAQRNPKSRKRCGFIRIKPFRAFPRRCAGRYAPAVLPKPRVRAHFAADVENQQERAFSVCSSAAELCAVQLDAGAHGGRHDAALLIYWPFAAAGFALTMASISNVTGSRCSFSAPKDALPMGTWMMLVLSRRYSILPALASVTARPTSGRDGTGLGVRHQAAGAEHLTQTAYQAHHIGRGDHARRNQSSLRSGSLRPDPRRPPYIGARLFSGLGGLSPLANTENAHRPCRCRGAARRRRAPAGPRDGCQRPGAHAARPSRRTSPWRSGSTASRASVGVVQFCTVDKLCAVDILFTVFHNNPPNVVIAECILPLTVSVVMRTVSRRPSTPMLRQVPAIMLMAALQVRRVQVGHLRARRSSAAALL